MGLTLEDESATIGETIVVDAEEYRNLQLDSRLLDIIWQGLEKEDRSVIAWLMKQPDYEHWLRESNPEYHETLYNTTKGTY